MYEVNFDGLIGPTHNYSGLAIGNLASMSNRYLVSYPKQAALEGLRKMRLLHDQGLIQGIIPPKVRPNLEFLKQHGYSGSAADVLKKVTDASPELLRMASSAASMWVANAATMTPSMDSDDERVHMSIANLATHAHRRMEAQETYELFKIIFPTPKFCVHPPLMSEGIMRDEGAANHMRLWSPKSQWALQVFVYGETLNYPNEEDSTGQNPVRQTMEASREVAFQNGLAVDRTGYIQQNPEAIEAGVFHNDVIATSHEDILIVHEQAYVNTDEVIEKLKARFKRVTLNTLQVIKVTEQQLSLSEAVESYVFNSQIVTRPDGGMLMIAPVQCQQGRAHDVICQIIDSANPIEDVAYVNLNQSMANGGGPACLRLRVYLTEAELKAVHPGFIMNPDRFAAIEQWIQHHYRDELHMEQLGDLELLQESQVAIKELQTLLGY